MAGETETGVTIMRVVKALDAGPMIAKVARPIGPDETSAEVERDLARLGADALVDAVDALAEGRASETPQDDAGRPTRTRSKRATASSTGRGPPREIHNQIRGLHPWPHAFSDLEGERTILLTLGSRITDALDRAAEPGTILDAHGDRLLVQTGDGVFDS